MFTLYYQVRRITPSIELFFFSFDRQEESAHRYYQEHLWFIKTSHLFNTYTPSLNRKTPFTKSGFIGKVAKRRKN